MYTIIRSKYLVSTTTATQRVCVCVYLFRFLIQRRYIPCSYANIIIYSIYGMCLPCKLGMFYLDKHIFNGIVKHKNKINNDMQLGHIHTLEVILMVFFKT